MGIEQPPFKFMVQLNLVVLSAAERLALGDSEKRTPLDCLTRRCEAQNMLPGIPEFILWGEFRFRAIAWDCESNSFVYVASYHVDSAQQKTKLIEHFQATGWNLQTRTSVAGEKELVSPRAQGDGPVH